MLFRLTEIPVATTFGGASPLGGFQSKFAPTDHSVVVQTTFGHPDGQFGDRDYRPIIVGGGTAAFSDAPPSSGLASSVHYNGGAVAAAGVPVKSPNNLKVTLISHLVQRPNSVVT